MRIEFHKNQLQVYKSDADLDALVCGRGFGKSHLLIYSAILSALTYDANTLPELTPDVVIICPTLRQAKQIIWKKLALILKNCPLVEDINRSDFRIILKGNKPEIIVRGADDGGDSLRGIKFYRVYFDEFQDIKPTVLEEIVLPRLESKGSKVVIVGTPKGKGSYFYSLIKKIESTPKWRYWHFKTEDNPFYPKDRIESLREVLSPKRFRQELEATWESFDGQIFTSLDDHHLIEPSKIPDCSTYFISLDPGAVNAALVVIGLTSDRKFYLVDSFYNETKEPITVDQVIEKATEFSKNYPIRRVFIPDDRTDMVKSFRVAGERLNIDGFKRAVGVKRNDPSPMERADYINNLFHSDRLFINNTLTSLITQFKDYHRQVDAEQLPIDKIADGQVDHCVDAAAYGIGRLLNNNIELLKTDGLSYNIAA